MKLIKKSKNTYVLRIDRGEEFLKTIKRFAKKERVFAGTFSAIGACSEAELAYFEPVAKRFTSKKFDAALEIVNITGNIALFGEEPLVHAHGLLSDKNMRVFGGHINSLLISTIAEVIIMKLDGTLHKKYSPNIGLNILQ